jgi:hypothetical protein
MLPGRVGVALVFEHFQGVEKFMGKWMFYQTSLELGDNLVVVGMAPNPKPYDVFAILIGQNAKMNTYPC